MSSILFQIYHATCHAEALASTSSLAARLRNEKAHGSRSATPEVHSITLPMTGVLATGLGLRSTPPPSSLSGTKSPPRSPTSKGTKRKVEHDDSGVPQEATGTPPLKKVALSATSSS